MAVRRVLHAFVLLALASNSVNAVLPDGRLKANQVLRPTVPRLSAPNGTVVSPNGTILPPYNTVYLFDQLIDHDNPDEGTFKQRYFHTAEFYQTDGPIILLLMGEVSIDSYDFYLTNETLPGLIAQQQNGATIVLENRFTGESHPRPDLSIENLQVHTIQQTIEDVVYFAKNVVLPMPVGGNVDPKHTPWILMGTSYGGALTSYIMVNKPDIFYAAYASSAPVQAIANFWRFFVPVLENMPMNCSCDVAAVIAHVDKVFMSGNQAAINTTKSNFGLASVTHLDDVANALRDNMIAWAALSVNTGSGGAFYEFCDALEVKDGRNAPAWGWGRDHALVAWGTYYNKTWLPSVCPDGNISYCYDSYDPNGSFYTDIRTSNAGRAFYWIMCNELGQWPDGPPFGFLGTTIVSRFANERHRCPIMFPSAFSPAFPLEARVALTNLRYQGWNVKATRLIFANGFRDTWLDATVSAERLHKRSTADQPIAVSDCFHGNDMITYNGKIDSTVGAVQKLALETMKKWLAKWTPRGERSGLGNQ